MRGEVVHLRSIASFTAAPHSSLSESLLWLPWVGMLIAALSFLSFVVLPPGLRETSKPAWGVPWGRMRACRCAKLFQQLGAGAHEPVLEGWKYCSSRSASRSRSSSTGSSAQQETVFSISFDKGFCFLKRV